MCKIKNLCFNIKGNINFKNAQQQNTSNRKTLEKVKACARFLLIRNFVHFYFYRLASP